MKRKRSGISPAVTVRRCRGFIDQVSATVVAVIVGRSRHRVHHKGVVVRTAPRPASAQSMRWATEAHRQSGRRGGAITALNEQGSVPRG